MGKTLTIYECELPWPPSSATTGQRGWQGQDRSMMYLGYPARRLTRRRRPIDRLSEDPLHASDLQHFWEVTSRMPEDSETAVSALRFAILRQMLPIQTASEVAGPKLELECTLLEAALSVIDWHQVLDFLKPHARRPDDLRSN